MINSLDPTREDYRVKAATPIPQNPVQPIGWTEPEQGVPQLGRTSGSTPTAVPQTTTTSVPINPSAPGGVGSPNTLPSTGIPATGGTGGAAPQPAVGLAGMAGLDFARQVTPNELVSNQLDQLTASNSRYMQNARRRGTEYANSRGNLNSSIGAGASERASLEAGLPIAQADAAAYGRAGDRTYDAADRIRQMGIESFLGQSDSVFSAQQQDWLNNNTFNREFNGQLALLPIANAADMWSGLMNLATQNPEVFTPTVLAGYQDFFQRGFDEYLSRYLRGGGP